MLEKTDATRETEREVTAGAIRDLIDRLRRNRGKGDGGDWGGGVILIGAGCSATAGIPTARGVVDLTLRHLASARLGMEDAQTRDPMMIYEELRRDGLQFDAAYGADLYYEIFDRHLDELNEQRALIRRAIELGAGRINWAHIRLGQLVAERCVHTVLTTNFDQLAMEGIIRNGVIPAVADGVDALDRVDSRPHHPQVVHLHGSLHNYSLRNSRRHISEVGTAFRAHGALYGLLRDAPFMLVVGYRGEEEGLMRPLRQALQAFPERRIFWASDVDAASFPKQVLDLEETGCILRILPGQDADDLFDNLATGARLGAPRWMQDSVAVSRDEHKRIVRPSNEVIQRSLDKYGTELEFLAVRLAEHRANATLATRQAENLDRFLLVGDFPGAQSYIESLEPGVREEPWARLAQAAADAVLDAGQDAAGRHLKAAIEQILPGPLPQRREPEFWRRTGDALDAIAESEIAEACYRRMEEMAAGPAQVRDLRAALERRAGMASDRSDYAAAGQLYGRLLEVNRQIAAETSSPDDLFEVTLTLHRLAELSRAQGDLAASDSRYREAVAALRSLVERTRSIKYLRSLLYALRRLASLSIQAGRSSEAEANLEEALAVHRRLEDAAVPIDRRDTLALLCELADMSLARGDSKQAERYQQELLNLLRAVAPGSSRSYQEELVTALVGLARILRAQGDHDRAGRSLAEALDRLRDMRAVSDTPGLRRATMSTLQELIESAGVGDDALAAEWPYGEVLPLAKMNVDRASAAEDREAYASMHGRLERLLRERDKTTGSRVPRR